MRHKPMSGPDLGRVERKGMVFRVPWRLGVASSSVSLAMVFLPFEGAIAKGCALGNATRSSLRPSSGERRVIDVLGLCGGYSTSIGEIHG